MNRLTVIFCVACVLMSLTFAVRASDGPKRTDLGRVQVKSLVLVDDEGKERASLKIGDGGGVWFDLLDGQGRRRLTLHSPRDPKAQSTLEVRTGHGGKVLMATGAEHASLSVQGDTRGSLLLTSRPETPASIWLTAQGGMPDAVFDVNRDCSVRLATVDEDQKHTRHIQTEPRSKE